MLDVSARPTNLPKSPKVVGFEVAHVMGTHDLFHRIGRLHRVIEWNLGSVMVQNMSLNGAMEEVTADESKVSVNG
jgi:hypothetical protein